MTFSGTLRSWLTSRHLPLVVAVMAVLLTLPSLWMGWQIDDYFHRMVLQGFPGFPDLAVSPVSLYSFADGDPGRTGRLMDAGFLPWWTLKELRINFFRPVTVLTHWLDHRLWPESPCPMHAHSLLWFGCLIVFAALFYRRIIGTTWVAGLAGLLYAIDDVHGHPVGWLANRNALLATIFGLLALVAHDRWRRNGWRFGAVLGPFCLAVGILSGEIAVATVAYLVAYALFLDRGKWRGRLIGLLPYVAVVIIWRLVYTYLGYGAWGSDYYIDPAREPVRFASAVLEYGPILFLGQWGLPWSDVFVYLPATRQNIIWLCSLAFLAVTGVVMIPLLRRDPVARFWAAGMCLSILPVCTTYPADRLLFFVGIGAMGILAMFLGGLVERADWLPPKRALRATMWAVGILFLAIHIVLAPLQLPLRTFSSKFIGPIFETTARQAPSDPDVEKQTLVFVNANEAMHVMYISFMRAIEGKPIPARICGLASGNFPIELMRLDDYTISVSQEGGFISLPFERIVRSKQHPMALGQKVKLTGMTVEVIALTEDGRPAKAAFRFAVPLEDKSLRWLKLHYGTYVPFSPPDVGETVKIIGGEVVQK